MPNLLPESVFSMPPALYCLINAFGGGRLLEIYYIYNVKVDILACIHFCVFVKIGNFAQIYIRVFDIVASTWHNQSYFHNVQIFGDI